MPPNHFKNREMRSKIADEVPLNSYVFIVEKHMQGTDNFLDLRLGKVARTLSGSPTPYNHGAKQLIYPIKPKALEKLPLMDWYNNYILNFIYDDIDFTDYIEEVLSYDLEVDETQTVVGRVQYFLLPHNYQNQRRTVVNTLLLGVDNENNLCDKFLLEKQIEYLKSNYYFSVNNFDDIVAALYKYRNLCNMFDTNTLSRMNIYPNYAEVEIHNNKYIKNIEYIEIKED